MAEFVANIKLEAVITEMDYAKLPAHIQALYVYTGFAFKVMDPKHNHEIFVSGYRLKSQCK